MSEHVADAVACLQGGKLDDITVVVAFVTSSSA